MLLIFKFLGFCFLLELNSKTLFLCLHELITSDIYLCNFYPLEESVVLPSRTICTFLFWVLIYILFLVFSKLIRSFNFHFSTCECILTVQLPVCIANIYDLLVCCSLLFCGWLLFFSINWRLDQHMI